MSHDAPAGVFAVLKATPTPVRYLLGGVLVNQLGAFVQTFLLLYLTVRGVSVGLAGLCLVAYSVGAIFGTLLGGELTHRLGPRATIVASMTASAPLVASIPWLGRPDLIWPLFAVVALAGLVTQAYRPAAAVLLSDLMPERHQVMGFSMMRIALNIGAALASLIAAGLILLDWDLLFWLDGLTAALYALLAFTLLPKTAGAEKEAAEAGVDRRSAYATLVRDGRFLLYLGAVFVGTIVYAQFTVALPLQIVADGHPEALYSAVLATSSIVLIVTELKLTTYVTRWPPQLAGGLGHVVFALGVAGWGLSAGSSVLVLVSAVFFVSGLMISGPSMFAHPAKAPSRVKARYVGTSHAVIGLASALGPAFGVFAWTRLGSGIWPLCGAMAVAAGLFAWAGMKQKTAPAVVAATEPVGEKA
ncbi:MULTISPECIES: MFS transporter [unclassified Amycolatopsis]|uniref:MFS transporter n=1 Tax=unclassified Amycolatopsis TaxID=2618356 RepID=UPI002874B0B4|nr:MULTISPECIES: MFS transporter [unclassified Amycolatopsis]MDS0139406.1 MFS transporter [Amycolatopsis sp. 505]MDS0149557.1 MFS transporter [Amycolatopsis sp. CM201R]